MAIRSRTTEKASSAGGDARIEEYLESKGVTYTFHPKVQPDDFDVERSLRNQVRFEPVDQTVVDEYAEAMKRGDEFPPVVSTKVGGKFVNADGNHRLVAATKSRKPLRVYDISDADPQLVTLIAFELNTKHGKPTSEAERTTHALYLMELGATVKSAAAAVNLPEKIVSKASAKQTTNARFTENSIPLITVDKLAETVKWRLSQISTDEGFVAAVELAMAAKLSADQTFDLVTRVNSVKSSTKQVDMIKDIRADMLGAVQESGGGVFINQGGKRVMGPRSRVNLALGNILALPDDFETIAKQWAGAEREEAAKKARDGARRLTALAKALSA